MYSYCDYSTDWFVVYDIEPVKSPKPHKAIGMSRRYHDNTVPPLDFR